MDLLNLTNSIYRIDPNLTPSRAFSERVCVTSEPQGAVHEAQMCYWRLVVGKEANQVNFAHCGSQMKFLLLL